MGLLAIDLFCGAGGFSQGVKLFGGKVILAIDADEDALLVHSNSHKCDHQVMKLGTAKSRLEILSFVEKVDLKQKNTLHVHASPPCQKFSTASFTTDVKEGMKLTRWTIELLRSLPSHVSFSMEQVDHPEIRKLLDKNALTYQVIKMEEYGIPQSRRRIIVTSKQINIPKSKASMIGLFKFPIGSFYIGNAYVRPSLLEDPSLKYVTMKKIEDGITSFTITSKGGCFIDKKKQFIRKFSLEERALLQTFPKDYFNVNLSNTRLYMCIGNAIPPKFVKKMMVALKLQEQKS